MNVISELDVEVAPLYLSLCKESINGIHILGVGGQVQVSEMCPLYFQNRDYIDGTEEANRELKELFFSGVDILATYSPIRYFTDNAEEEKNVRNYLCDYLPGKIILTGQALLKEPSRTQKTATDAYLIRGGHFGRPPAGMTVKDRRFGCYWDIKVNKEGVIHKHLGQVITGGRRL